MAGYELVNNGQSLSWDNFEKIIKDDISQHKKEDAQAGVAEYHSPWIYRGQSNSEWELVTTYERYLKNELGIDDEKYNPDKFYRQLVGIIPAINSLTSQKF